MPDPMTAHQWTRLAILLKRASLQIPKFESFAVSRDLAKAMAGIQSLHEFAAKRRHHAPHPRSISDPNSSAASSTADDSGRRFPVRTGTEGPTLANSG